MLAISHLPPFSKTSPLVRWVGAHVIVGNEVGLGKLFVRRCGGRGPSSPPCPQPPGFPSTPPTPFRSQKYPHVFPAKFYPSHPHKKVLVPSSAKSNAINNLPIIFPDYCPMQTIFFTRSAHQRRRVGHPFVEKRKPIENFHSHPLLVGFLHTIYRVPQQWCTGTRSTIGNRFIARQMDLPSVLFFFGISVVTFFPPS